MKFNGLSYHKNVRRRLLTCVAVGLILASSCSANGETSGVDTAEIVVAESSSPGAVASPTTNKAEGSDSVVGSDTAAPTTPAVTEVPTAGVEMVPLRFESRVDDVATSDLAAHALKYLNDPRSWGRAGFSFSVNADSPYQVILAEGSEVDRLCLPLRTGGTVSCQNGPVVALNADRWRGAVEHWDLTVEEYRGYLVNHEVGHLIGQRHPLPRCPVEGAPAAVMEQQTGSLKGCKANPWPRDWEIELAAQRPVVYAPLPAWAPDPVPENREDREGR